MPDIQRSAFSPGPWTQTRSSDRGWHLADSTGGFVMYLWGTHVSEADARLITAAPALLAACKLALSAFTSNNAIDWSDLEAAIFAAEGAQ